MINPGTVAGISRNVRRALRRLRSRRFRERGLAPIIVLAALITTVAVAGMVASAVVHAGQTISYQGQVRSAFTRSEQLEQRMSAEAQSSKAIFAPATAVDGAANCAGGQCREIDFYASGATAAGNRGNFIAYLATAAGSVQRYVYTGTAGGVAHGVSADGAAIAGTQFYVREVPVTSLTTDPDVTPTTKAQLTAAGVVPHRWTFQYEHFGVAASNDVFYVHFNAGAAPSSGGPGWGAAATGNDVFALSVLTKPVSASTQFISKTFSPTTPPITSVGPSQLFFPFPGSPNQGLQVHETNYHDAFNAVGPCQMVGSTIASLVSTSVFPSPNIADTDSGPATFTFIPTTPGICSQTISDSYGTTALLPVQVAGPLNVTPTTIAMSLHGSPPVPYPGNTAVVTGTKTWSYIALSLSASNCPIVSAVQSETDAPTFSATPAGGQLTITATATGSCTMTVSDQFGESQNVSIVVYDDPVYNMMESPPTGTIGRGSSWSTATVAATVAALPPGHSYYPGTAANLTVGVIAQSYTGSAGGCAWGPSGYQAPGTSFSVTDNDAVGGVCTLTFSANTGSANNPFASLSPESVAANITFTPQAHQQVQVCNTDPLSGTTNWSTNPPTDYVGTTASPPCAAPPVATPPPGPTPMATTAAGATAFTRFRGLHGGSDLFSENILYYTPTDGSGNPTGGVTSVSDFPQFGQYLIYPANSLALPGDGPQASQWDAAYGACTNDGTACSQQHYTLGAILAMHTDLPPSPTDPIIWTVTDTVGATSGGPLGMGSNNPSPDISSWGEPWNPDGSFPSAGCSYGGSGLTSITTCSFTNGFSADGNYYIYFTYGLSYKGGYGSGGGNRPPSGPFWDTLDWYPYWNVTASAYQQ